MNHRNSTGRDIITTIITKIIYLGGSFLISVFLARILGPEGKGVLTALFVVPNIIISLADLGVRQASAYYIGRKIYSVQEVLSSSLILWFFSSMVSVIIVLLYYLSPATDNYGWFLSLIALAYIPMQILSTYLQGIIQGQQKIGNINVKTLISNIVHLLGLVMLVWLLDLGVYGAASATLLVVVTGLAYYVIVVKRTAKFQIKYIKPIPQDMFTKGIAFALSLFVIQLNYKVDIVILQTMVSSAEVGIYSVGINLAELLWQLPAAISIVLFARSANSKTDEEASQRSARLLRLSLALLFVVVLFFGLTSNFFVTLLYGAEFSQSATIINILLPGVLVMVISKILHPSLAARGYPLYGLAAFILPLILNVVLNYIFIPIYGIYGAAFTSTISYIIGGLSYGFIYSKKENMKLLDLLIVKKEDIQLVINTIKRK